MLLCAYDYKFSIKEKDYDKEGYVWVLFFG